MPRWKPCNQRQGHRVQLRRLQSQSACLKLVLEHHVPNLRQTQSIPGQTYLSAQCIVLNPLSLESQHHHRCRDAAVGQGPLMLKMGTVAKSFGAFVKFQLVGMLIAPAVEQHGYGCKTGRPSDIGGDHAGTHNPGTSESRQAARAKSAGISVLRQIDRGIEGRYEPNVRSISPLDTLDADG